MSVVLVNIGPNPNAVLKALLKLGLSLTAARNLTAQVPATLPLDRPRTPQERVFLSTHLAALESAGATLSGHKELVGLLPNDEAAVRSQSRPPQNLRSRSFYESLRGEPFFEGHLIVPEVPPRESKDGQWFQRVYLPEECYERLSLTRKQIWKHSTVISFARPVAPAGEAIDVRYILRAAREEKLTAAQAKVNYVTPKAGEPYALLEIQAVGRGSDGEVWFDLLHSIRVLVPFDHE